jgi:hypothetical protein
MSDIFQKIILSLSQCSLFDKAKNEWIILYKENKSLDCICGHKVKYSSTIYNIFTRTSIDVGTICCKKYGITNLCENQILIRAIKKYRDSVYNNENILYIEDNTQLENIIKQQIEEEYNRIFGKLELENEYYRVVPLNRLLTDLIDLQSNYNISFMTYILEIQQDIEMLEQNNDIYCQEELEKSLEDSIVEEDLASEISLLSFYTEIPLEPQTNIIREPQNYSINELKEKLQENEIERTTQLDKLSKAIYLHEFHVGQLIMRIKDLRENIMNVTENVNHFVKRVKEFTYQL